MKKRSILPIMFALALSGCDLISLDGFGGLSNLFNKPETQNNQNNSTQNNNQNTGNDSGGQTSGGQTSGGNDSGNGHNQAAQPADVSKWPSDQRKYVTTFLNGKLPYYSAFNDFKTRVVDQSQKPLYNPAVKNTNPVTNYEFEYGDLLRKAGWISQGEETDENGVLQHYYKYDDLFCQYAKYRGTDGIYYFDVYAFNDYEAPFKLDNSVLSLDVESMSLKNQYEKNQNYSKEFTSTTNGQKYKITANQIMKANTYYIQLQKDNGKLCIEGPSKGIAFTISQNADALFVKYGSNKTNLQYAFNNGGTFNFPTQANYIEITAESRVVDFETIDILN